ncbi:MAG: DUF1559 domain-containing protein [Thermoguttaceae bacterium]
MQELGVALRSYHAAHGTFPPAYTVNENGEPLHSWRTLILPFLGQNDLYQEICLDEPWDSEHNKQFHKRMRQDFRCPRAPFTTSSSVYKLVFGAGTAAGLSLSSFKRSPSEVVLLVESWSPVPWMSPADFSLDDFKTAIYPPELEKRKAGQDYITFEESNPHNRPVLGGYHAFEFHVLFADGSVKTYKKWKLPIAELEKMSHIE